MDRKTFSIVAPCCNEEKALSIFYNVVVVTKIEKNISIIYLNFIFADDGSKDNTLAVMQKLSHEDERVQNLNVKKKEVSIRDDKHSACIKVKGEKNENWYCNIPFCK